MKIINKFINTQILEGKISNLEFYIQPRTKTRPSRGGYKTLQYKINEQTNHK